MILNLMPYNESQNKELKRRAVSLQMVSDMRRTRRHVLYVGKSRDARYPDDDHSVDKVTIPSKVCSLGNMEEAGPSVTEKPTNGSLCLKVDFEIDDDVYDDRLHQSVRDLNKLAEDRSLTEIPQMDPTVSELAIRNSDHDTMIAAPSVRDLDQLAEVSRMRQV
ncbi:hypothetical protein Tco_1491853 [Tanacetum coccineum]